MKKTKLIGGAVSAVMFIGMSLTAFAETFPVKTDVPQPDEICGYVNITGSTEHDIYVKIKKRTPETGRDGYIVYDDVISAGEVGSGDMMSYALEYNNYSADIENYDGSYDVYIGVNKYNDSKDPGDIVYQKINLLVCDINYCNYETFCEVDVNFTDKPLGQPVMSSSGELPNIKYDVTFSVSQKPTEPPTQPDTEPTAEPDIIYGDANGDNVINIRDAALIASKLSKSKSSELSESADYNRDGKINIRDAAAIASDIAKGKIK